MNNTGCGQQNSPGFAETFFLEAPLFLTNLEHVTLELL